MMEITSSPSTVRGTVLYIYCISINRQQCVVLPTVKKQPILINVILQVHDDLTDVTYMRQAKYCSICKL